jgi:hypothetical protein
MKKQIASWLILIVFIALGIFVYVYGGKPEIPTVGANGEINGNYAIGGIMRLGKPYACTFEKSDATSQIAGVIHTDGQRIYGEFRIQTDLLKNNFSSFLLIKDGVAYSWTSLQDIGYKSSAAQSASKNASPIEQAQIIGIKDRVPYKCRPWLEVDNTIFDVPTSIKFSELNK